MSSNPILKLISNSKEFISETRNQLENIPLQEIIKFWQEQINNSVDYKNEIDEMIRCNILPKKFTDGNTFSVGGFRYISQQAILTYIRENNKWSDSKKKRLTNCYTSFIDWLNTISFDWFKTDLPSYQMSPKAIEKTLTFDEFRRFIEILYKNNPRDELIARILLKKRVSKVLNLKADDIYFENNTIRYAHKGKVEIVQYESEFIKELQEYVVATAKFRKNSKFVFITKRGNPVVRSRLNHFFIKICKMAGVKRISPDSLRAIYEMFIQQKYKDSKIMQGGRKSLKLNQENSQ